MGRRCASPHSIVRLGLLPRPSTPALCRVLLSAPCRHAWPIYPRRLVPVLDPQRLVGGAQMLLYGGFGEEEAPRYLTVAHALGDQLQDLSLAGSQVRQICGG